MKLTERVIVITRSRISMSNKISISLKLSRILGELKIVKSWTDFLEIPKSQGSIIIYDIDNVTNQQAVQELLEIKNICEGCLIGIISNRNVETLSVYSGPLIDARGQTMQKIFKDLDINFYINKSNNMSRCFQKLKEDFIESDSLPSTIQYYQTV